MADTGLMQYSCLSATLALGQVRQCPCSSFPLIVALQWFPLRTSPQDFPLSNSPSEQFPLSSSPSVVPPQ